MTEQAQSTRRTQIFVLAAVVAWAAVIAACVERFGLVAGFITGLWGVPIVVIVGAGVVHHRARLLSRPVVVDESVELDLTADAPSLQPVG